MASLQTMKKYIGHTFDDWGGVVSDDYKTFQTKYLSYINSLCKANGWKLIHKMKNHYEFAAVIQKNDAIVYMSISDVRHFKNAWHRNILVRTMKHEKDWTGNSNNFCTIDELENMIAKL